MLQIVTHKKLLRMYKSKDAGLRATKNISKFLPLYSSERLAGIVGDLFGDGHLQGNPKWRLDFTSSSVEELRRFEREFYLQFGVRGKIRECLTNKFGTTYNYGINNKPIARVLFLSGVPTGNKVLQKTKIPKWILSNKLYFTRFAQRLFDCEGCVDVDSKCIEINMSKASNLLTDGYEFFYQLKRYLMKYHGIKTTNPFTVTRFNVRKDGIKTKPIKLKIKNKESLIKFNESVGFETYEKRQKLTSAIRSSKNWEHSSKL